MVDDDGWIDGWMDDDGCQGTLLQIFELSIPTYFIG
jgi:hypothetical protein